MASNALPNLVQDEKTLLPRGDDVRRWKTDILAIEFTKELSLAKNKRQSVTLALDR